LDFQAPSGGLSFGFCLKIQDVVKRRLRFPADGVWDFQAMPGHRPLGFAQTSKTPSSDVFWDFEAPLWEPSSKLNLKFHDAVGRQ
jgi:hypothetical protein